MRSFIVLCGSLALAAGCGSGGGSGMAGPPAASGDYVPGPFGYTEGKIIENISFNAKWDPAGAQGAASYDQLALKPLTLGDLHQEPSLKYIVIAGVAGWCVPCSDEQAGLPALQAKYESRGFRFLEAMIQGYDLANSAPASEADIDHWAITHKLHLIMALDPGDKMRQFADVSAFPVNMIIRSSDMKIVYLQLGKQELDPVLDKLP
jgi:hypothetical protein